MKYLLFLTIIFLSGCASAPRLSASAKKVVLIKPDKKICTLKKKNLHIIAWFNKRSAKVLKNKLFNEAAEIGANALEIKSVYRGSDQAIADAYHCPENYLANFKDSLEK